MASSPAPIRTLDDLIGGLTSQGTERRSAVLRIIRDIENGEISVIPPYSSPWPPDQVLRWLLQFLQKLANWQPGARPPLYAFPDGVPEYLDRLRFRLVEKKNSARAGAGRPPVGDWDEAELFAFKLFDERGDPDEPGQDDGWRTRTDVADAVHQHLVDLASKSGKEPPDHGTVRRRVPRWLADWRAAKRSVRN
jgi:hypothetical protein